MAKSGDSQQPIRFSPTLLSNSRVIARGLRIREVHRLVRNYGGRAARWAKKSSPILHENGLRVEYHWYEHHGLGRFEVKRRVLNSP